MSQSTQGLDRTEPSTPDPEDPRKPDDPADIHKRTWRYVAKKVPREVVYEAWPAEPRILEKLLPRRPN